MESVDKVLAEDPETGEQGYYEVIALTNHPTDEILQITIDSGPTQGDNEDTQLNSPTDDQPAKPSADQPAMMEVTPEHPVYVEGKGWLWAENLSIGDRLRRSDGGWAKVLAVERTKLDKPELVYNFTVKGPHTYFVLEVGVLVHNASCEIIKAKIEEVEEIIDDVRKNSTNEVILRGVGNNPFFNTKTQAEAFGAKKFEFQLINGTKIEDIAKNIDINGVKAQELLDKGRADIIKNFYNQKMRSPVLHNKDPQGFIGGVIHGGSSYNSGWLSTTTSPWEATRFARGGGTYPRDKGYIIVFSPTDPLRPPIANLSNKRELEILIPVGITEDQIHKIISLEGLRDNWSIKENIKRAEEQWLRMGGSAKF